MTKKLDLEAQFRDVRKQLQDQLGCLDFRMESKLSLLNEFQEFFKRRGEVESEYSRSLERLCERFERNTKQRNIKSEVRSTFNLWSTLLAETRKISRERSAVAEVWSQEMSARIGTMQADVNFLTKKCKEMCMEIQEQYLKELRDFGELTKLYQHSCHNVAEAIEKHSRLKEKAEGMRESRKKKAEDKEKERLRQYKTLCHQLLKNRNDYIMGMTKCNAFSLHYFNRDILELVEYMDYDYHDSLKRVAEAYRLAEKGICSTVLQSADTLVEQAKALNFETDLNYFLNEFSQSFHPPSEFQFMQFDGNDVCVYKVNTEDVYTRSEKAVVSLREEKDHLEVQREEDEKTIRHMKQLNLMKYKVVTVEDAIRLLEENGESLPSLDSSMSRTGSLEKGLTYGALALQQSQKGKKDTLLFTLGIVQRNLQRSDQLEMINTQLSLLETALDEQKVKPVPVQIDSHGRAIPGEVPKLFGGDLRTYIESTGASIPLIVESCVKAIEKDGLKVEGLFRVPGPAALIEELRNGFEEGRDPLASSKQKIDHTAVASVLKAYFRELPTPLFPTEKYQEFIQCARRENPTERMNALKATITSLPHPIVNVMAYLFRFLYRVSLDAKDNKMGSANLALVFGPTLTRAPGNIDPRQLHNDVPAVNLLIQLCINSHKKIFGGEHEEEEEPPSPLSPGYNATMSPSNTMEMISAALVDQKHDEVCYLAQTSAPATCTDVGATEESTDVNSQPPPSVAPPTTAPPTITVDAVPKPEGSAQPAEPEAEKKPSGLSSQTSTASLSQEFKTIDEALKSIEGNLVEMKCVEEEEEVVVKEGVDEGTEDSETEDEDDVLKIECTALYDYTARSDKELSFKRGDQLQVIEKTPDSNWWDGFHQGKRGFIPVSYVEIAELQPSDSLKAIPQPPMRKSSIHRADECAEVCEKVSEEPKEVPIAEERSSTPSDPAAKKDKEATPPPPSDPTSDQREVTPPPPPPPELAPAPPSAAQPVVAADKPAAAVEKPSTPVHRAAVPAAEKPPDKPAELADKPTEAAEKPPTSTDAVDRPGDQGAKEGSQPPPETSEDVKKVDKSASMERNTSVDKPATADKNPLQGVKGNVSKLKAQFSAEPTADVKAEVQLGHRRQRSTDGHKSELADDLARSSSASGGSKVAGTPEDASARALSTSGGMKQDDLPRSSSGGSKTGMATTPTRVPVGPPPTKPKPPITAPASSAPTTTPATPTTTTTPAEPSSAFTITSHASGISPLQRAAAVAAVAAVVTPAKPPMPTKAPPPPSSANKVKRNGSQKQEEKPPPMKPKAGDKNTDMLRAELQAAVAKKPPTNE